MKLKTYTSTYENNTRATVVSASRNTVNAGQSISAPWRVLRGAYVQSQIDYDSGNTEIAEYFLPFRECLDEKISGHSFSVQMYRMPG